MRLKKAASRLLFGPVYRGKTTFPLSNRSLFPGDEAVFELLYLVLRNISQRWTMPIQNWGGALNQFAIIFEGRVLLSGMSLSTNS